jgi:uncharacterized protein YjbJ (UPF0337 family)
MSIVDKVSGKIKQAFGETTKDPEIRREGVREERKGQKKDELHETEREAERKAEEVGDLERRS